MKKNLQQNTAAKKNLTLGGLIMMNLVAVVSLNGLPAEAEYGLSLIFYYVFAAIMFLIPVSLVAAELASTYPEKGGVARWVGEAMGPKFAFLSMFLLCAEVTIWFPTVLTFAAVSLAFINPDMQSAIALSSNKMFVLPIVLGIFWGAIFVSSRGIKTFAKVAKWGGIIGTVIPALLLIVLGFAYIISGQPAQIDLSPKDILPDFTKFDNLALAASIFLFYAGMEMNAIHVTEIDNPKRNYPIAIFVAAIGTVSLFVFGTLAIAFVIPRKDINLTQSLLVTYHKMFEWAGISFLAPVIAIALAIGILAAVVTWVSGPSNGLLEIGKAGYLPMWWHYTNKHGSATHILYVQGGIVTLLSIVFVLLPSVQSAYQILSQLTTILYLIVYMLMFSSAIRLRYSQPNRPRPYRVPGGKAGIWIVGGVGFFSSAVAFFFSFVPPGQINVGSPVLYVGILLVLMVVFCIIPFVVMKFKKDSWQDPNEDFAPFTWQLEGTKPGKINKSDKEADELVNKHFEEKLKKEMKHLETDVKEEAEKLEERAKKGASEKEKSFDRTEARVNAIEKEDEGASTSKAYEESGLSDKIYPDA